MISAGEASGDIHAAKLVEALQEKAADAFPDDTALECFGMGGTNLAERGVELLVDVDNNAVMGLLEVLHKYPSLRASLSTLRKAMSDREPDILILVDYPHFNMKLATTARELGIPVLFFIAPKVWASRPGRVNELKKIVDHIALILPFEKKQFDDAGIPATYVGNPLLDNKQLLKAAETTSLKNNHALKRIALLPGSRKSEVSMLLPPMLETCEALLASVNERSSLPDKEQEDREQEEKEHGQNSNSRDGENTTQQVTLEFVLPVADTIKREDINAVIDQYNVDIKLIKPTDYNTLRGSDAALVASGTATLELAILGIPMVVIYKLNSISYQIIRRILTTEYISLVNIMTGRPVVPEVLQDDVTAENLAREVNKLLTDNEARDQQIKALAEVYKQLGNEGASSRTAELALSLVQEKSADLAVG